MAGDERRSRAPHSSKAAAKAVEWAVMPATPAVVPAESVGGTADMAGLATRSTSETIETCDDSVLR